MDRKKLIKIVENAKDASNSDLSNASAFLTEEFDKTKNLIIELTRHMDNISEMFDKINAEYKNRFKK